VYKMIRPQAVLRRVSVVGSAGPAIRYNNLKAGVTSGCSGDRRLTGQAFCSDGGSCRAPLPPGLRGMDRHRIQESGPGQPNGSHPRFAILLRFILVALYKVGPYPSSLFCRWRWVVGS